jgi:hypothetical protein
VEIDFYVSAVVAMQHLPDHHEVCVLLPKEIEISSLFILTGTGN